MLMICPDCSYIFEGQDQIGFLVNGTHIIAYNVFVFYNMKYYSFVVPSNKTMVSILLTEISYSSNRQVV